MPRLMNSAETPRQLQVTLNLHKWLQDRLRLLEQRGECRHVGGVLHCKTWPACVSLSDRRCFRGLS